MTRNEKLQTILEALGTEATMLDAAYVLQQLEEDGLSVEEIGELEGNTWREIIDDALAEGAKEIREVLSAHGDIPATMERELEARRLRQALADWLRFWDYVAAGGTSETPLINGHDEALDEMERSLASHEPRGVIEDLADWWVRAYAAYTKARTADEATYAQVVEALTSDDLVTAEDLLS